MGPRSASGTALPLRSRGAEPLFDGPVVILAVARSFSSIVGTMIGRHPQLYGLPELHLWRGETLGDWWQICRTNNLADGLLRTVAELYFGEQTEETVVAARGWIRRRLSWTTGELVEQLAERVHPRVLVEKSPSTTSSLDYMEQAEQMFPEARYIHLVRHPVSQGASLLGMIEEFDELGMTRGWMRDLAGLREQDGLPPDPTREWRERNEAILEFLSGVGPDRQLTLRGEEVLAEPHRWCALIAEWLGAETGFAAVDAMTRPEESPYASVGPPGAAFGNDPHFLFHPQLRSDGGGKPASLADPLPWADGAGLAPRVRALAEWFGYR